jgi:hypothetical protein
MNTSESLFVQMALMSWQTQNARVDDLLNKLPDEQLMNETAPGRNRGVYLLGHLAAVNDGLFKILGIAERLHPELDDVFLNTPDKAGQSMPTIEELKKYWKEINAALTDKFNTMQPQEWFEKHTAVSAEDFAKEPYRNKLNVLLNRTAHQSYHLGQMNYLKS